MKIGKEEKSAADSLHRSLSGQFFDFASSVSRSDEHFTVIVRKPLSEKQ